MEPEEIEFSDELWMRVEDSIITIGAKQELFDDVSELWGVDLPEEGQEVSVENICGEIETDQGPINIYSPVDGEVVEINTAVIGEPDLLFDDSVEDGWLLKIEALDPSDLEKLLSELEES